MKGAGFLMNATNEMSRRAVVGGITVSCLFPATLFLILPLINMERTGRYRPVDYELITHPVHV
jgi:hypothetical protein